MSIKSARAVLIALCLMISLASSLPGCAWKDHEMAPPLEGEPIVIGIPLPLTGSKAAFGEIKRNAYEMAAEEINAAGGIDGRLLSLSFRDTAGEPDSAASVAEALISVDGVTFLAGEYSSACALAVAGVAQRHKIPYLIDSAAADSITQQKWDYVFRLNPPANLFAQGLTAWFGEVVKPRSMVIVYEHSDFGSSVAKAMRDWCRRAGVRVPVYEGYEPGTLDFTPIISKAKDASPDVVYMVSYLMDASLIVRQARAQGLRPKVFAGGAAGFVLPEFITNAGDATENVVTAALWAPSLGYPGAHEFAETYRARFGDYPTYHAAESYSCVYVIADVIRRAASTHPDRIRVALADTELMTVFGPVKFEEFEKYRNQNRMNTLVLQIIGGKHEVVWPPEFATAAYVYPDPASLAETAEPADTGR
ncbi:MAG: ABC transporter substrate-binding protein [Bacillota bacterium]|nr:MAG: ABC transporter substrate-binding protein [Bacillota bacterium]